MFFMGAFVLAPRLQGVHQSGSTPCTRNGLLSPALSSKGGEGGPSPRFICPMGESLLRGVSPRPSPARRRGRILAAVHWLNARITPSGSLSPALSSRGGEGPRGVRGLNARRV